MTLGTWLGLFVALIVAAEAVRALRHRGCAASAGAAFSASGRPRGPRDPDVSCHRRAGGTLVAPFDPKRQIDIIHLTNHHPRGRFCSVRTI